MSDNDLKHALTVTPLAHLVPTQALHALLCPLTLPQVEESYPRGKTIDVADEEVMKLLGKELLEYDVDMPIFFKEYFKTGGTSSIPLNETERQLLAKNTVPYCTKVTTVQPPRLSVRKKYNATEMDHHNRNYEKKFSKELKELNVKRQTEHTQPTTRKLVKLSEADIEKSTTTRIMLLLETPTPQSFEDILDLIDVPQTILNTDQSRQVISVCKKYLAETVPELSTTTPDIMGPMSASLCIATVMNKNRFDLKFRVDDTFSEVAQLVYWFVHTMLTPEHMPRMEGPILYICDLLKKLSFMSTIVLCDEESLTKFEISAIHILFEELDPEFLLKHATATFLADLYHLSYIQRKFLLNELTTNFLRLPTKKSEARNYRTHRGFNILVFTAVAVKFAREESDANVLARELVLRVTSNFDATAKTLLELLVEDLIHLLPFGEWAASAALLYGLATTMLAEMKNPAVEVFFLELLGTISSSVHEVKHLFHPNFLKPAFEECLEYGSDTDLNYVTHAVYDKHPRSRKRYIELLVLDLDKFCNAYLTLLGKCLNSPKTKLKTKAVKVLSVLSDKQPNLLNSKVLQLALSARLCDEATLVRDAVYEFIGKYIKAHPNEADNFYNSLCNALSDEGVSVRKKAIRLTRDIYPMFSETSRISIATKMLKRLNDEEDNIRKEAASMLVDCWIRKHLVLEMITLAMSHHKTLEGLETFLESYVFPEKELQPHLKQLVETLLDMQTEGALLLLSVCSSGKPDLIGQDLLIALQPFLTDANNVTQKSYQYGLKVLRCALPHITSLRPDFIDPLQEFLFAKLTKMTKKELHEAVPSLWQLCKIKQDFTKLVNAVISTMKMIWKNTEPHRLAKLIQLLACLEKHCDLERFREMFAKANLGLKTNESVVSLSVKYILTFCGDTPVRSTAVNNLLIVCSNSPRILMSPPVLSVFDEALDSTPDVIKGLLQTMIDFIQERDKQSSASSSLEDIVDDACPGLVQRYIEKILVLSLSDKGKFAYLPFQFVQVALDLGFANPKICISTVISLEASSQPLIHCSAIAMHQKLFDKHESLVDSSYQESIRKAFDAGLTSPIFFNSIYTIIHRSKTSRSKFLTALGRVLVLGDIHFLLFCVERTAAITFKYTDDVLVVLKHLQDEIRTVDVADLDQPQALSVCALIELYRYFTTAYKISEHQINNPDINSKQTIKVKANHSLDLGWITDSIGGDCLDRCLETIRAFI